jgi:hypothetical protein
MMENTEIEEACHTPANANEKQPRPRMQKGAAHAAGRGLSSSSELFSKLAQGREFFMVTTE